MREKIWELQCEIKSRQLDLESFLEEKNKKIQIFEAKFAELSQNPATTVKELDLIFYHLNRVIQDRRSQKSDDLEKERRIEEEKKRCKNYPDLPSLLQKKSDLQVQLCDLNNQYYEECLAIFKKFKVLKNQVRMEKEYKPLKAEAEEFVNTLEKTISSIEKEYEVLVHASNLEWEIIEVYLQKIKLEIVACQSKLKSLEKSKESLKPADSVDEQLLQILTKESSCCEESIPKLNTIIEQTLTLAAPLVTAKRIKSEVWPLEKSNRALIAQWEALQQEGSIILADPLLGHLVIERFANKLINLYEDNSKSLVRSTSVLQRLISHPIQEKVEKTLNDKKEVLYRERITQMIQTNKEALVLLANIEIKLFRQFIAKSKIRCKKISSDFNTASQLQGVDCLILLGSCSKKIKEEIDILQDKIKKDSLRNRFAKEIESSKELEHYLQERLKLEQYCEEQLCCLREKQNVLREDLKNIGGNEIVLEEEHDNLLRGSVLAGIVGTVAGSLLALALGSAMIAVAISILTGVVAVVVYHFSTAHLPGSLNNTPTGQGKINSFLYNNRHVGVENNEQQASIIVSQNPLKGELASDIILSVENDQEISKFGVKSF